jgi:hypothetical protein
VLEKPPSAEADGPLTTLASPPTTPP